MRLDVISNEGNDFDSKWLDEEGKASREGWSLVDMVFSFSEVVSSSFGRVLRE